MNPVREAFLKGQHRRCQSVPEDLHPFFYHGKRLKCDWCRGESESPFSNLWILVRA